MHCSSIQTKKRLSNLCVTSPLIHTGIHVKYMKCIQQINLIFTYLILLLCYTMIDYKLSLFYAQLPRKLKDAKWADCQSLVTNPEEIQSNKAWSEANKKQERRIWKHDFLTYARTCWALKCHTKKRRRKKNKIAGSLKVGLRSFSYICQWASLFYEMKELQTFGPLRGLVRDRLGSWCWRVWDYKLRAYGSTDFYFFGGSK